MTTIHTVDVAKFTAPVTGELIGIFDVCIGDDGFVHLRVNSGGRHGQEAVLRLHRDQVRRIRNILDKAIDGLVPMGN